MNASKRLNFKMKLLRGRSLTNQQFPDDDELLPQTLYRHLYTDSCSLQYQRAKKRLDLDALNCSPLNEEFIKFFFQLSPSVLCKALS
jgi:hypothetical protein